MTGIKIRMEALLNNVATLPFGLIVEVNNVPAFTRNFYAARKRLNLPGLSLRTPPDRSETQVWLVQTHPPAVTESAPGEGGQHDLDRMREIEAALSNLDL